MKILCIDDESDIRDIFEYMFEHAGHDVKTCSSGEEGWEVAIVFQPDLILLDVMMPNVDGVETLEKLKAMKETKSIPVIFVTAKSQPDEVLRLQALPVIQVITKPFDAISFPSKVIEIMKEHKDGE